MIQPIFDERVLFLEERLSFEATRTVHGASGTVT